MAKIHSCERQNNCLRNDEYFKIYLKYDSAIKKWIMTLEQYADKEEVEMGEADYDGELICVIETPVFFCPYCGVELSDQ